MWLIGKKQRATLDNIANEWKLKKIERTEKRKNNNIWLEIKIIGMRINGLEYPISSYVNKRLDFSFVQFL